MKDPYTLENRVLNNHKRIVRLEAHLDRLVSLVGRVLATQGEIIGKVTEEHDDGMTDVEADSDALAGAGYGTDEDYGGTDERL